MLLVQLAIDDVEATLTPTVNAFKNVEFALDVSWDVFLVVSMILFGVAMLADPEVRPLVRHLGNRRRDSALRIQLRDVPDAAGSGSAGLVDLGPAVGLWYAGIDPTLLRRDKTPRGGGRGA